MCWGSTGVPRPLHGDSSCKVGRRALRPGSAGVVRHLPWNLESWTTSRLVRTARGKSDTSGVVRIQRLGAEWSEWDGSLFVGSTGRTRHGEFGEPKKDFTSFGFYVFVTRQCRQRHYYVRHVRSLCPLVHTHLVTTISHECLEQFW